MEGKMPKRVIWAIATILALTVGGVGLATQSARAQQPQVCVTGIYNYCLNAWNGGPWIRTYGPNVQNDYFYIQGIDECYKHSDLSSPTCPFYLGSGLNVAGDLVFQIVDGRTGQCVGDDPAKDGQTYETGCNNPSTGTGGGYGTIFVQRNINGCSGGSNFISREWSDKYDFYYGLTQQSGNGHPVYDDGSMNCYMQF
jgi:hypothetical protein